MLNGPILREKALNIARNLGHSDFLASVGWLAKFRERCDICSIKLHGEGGSCPREISESSRKSLQALTADYQPNLIFNADESALFYRQLPNKGFVFLNEAKSRQLRGYDEMSSKDRLTLHLCTNSDGSLRVPMLIIGQSKSPLSLQVSYIISINIHSMQNHELPQNIFYQHQTNSWMTMNIFRVWLLEIFIPFVARYRGYNQVLLLLDNASSHAVPDLPEDVRHWLRVEFFPAHCTSQMQPLDMGIIQTVQGSPPILARS
jgi:hypothetical protein